MVDTVVALFVEDIGQVRFLTRLMERVAAEQEPSLQARIITRNATGGGARVIAELRRFVRDLPTEEETPDLIVVALDCDCRRRSRVVRDLQKLLAGRVSSEIVFALPEPHVERWYLADQAALQRVTGAPGMPSLPPPRCRKDLFKRALADAFGAGDLYPSLGGVEYAEEIVSEMDLSVAARNDASLGAFIQDFRHCVTRLTN